MYLSIRQELTPKELMPIRTYARNLTLTNGVVVQDRDLYVNSTNSPRGPAPLKRLLLRQNAYSRKSAALSVIQHKPGKQQNGSSTPPVWENPPIQGSNQVDAKWPASLPSFATVDSVVLAKFNGKLRKGGASLGVTLASAKQSREMIYRQFREPTAILGKTIRRLDASPHEVARLRRDKEPLANQILEVEFGWRPLFSDIHSALFTVCKDGIPDSWIRASHRVHAYDYRTQFRPGYENRSWEHTATRSSTMCARVAISNPNLWLLNRLGLINPFVVAWDLVPWSFVANMFININQLLHSLTDWVGLDVQDLSTTRTTRSLIRFKGRNQMHEGLLLETENTFRQTDRTLNSKPDVSLRFKAPELNWETVLIASSLAVQRVNKINRLIRVL